MLRQYNIHVRYKFNIGYPKKVVRQADGVYLPVISVHRALFKLTAIIISYRDLLRLLQHSPLLRTQTIRRTHSLTHRYIQRQSFKRPASKASSG